MYFMFVHRLTEITVERWGCLDLDSLAIGLTVFSSFDHKFFFFFLLFVFYTLGFRANTGDKPMVLLNGIIIGYALFYIM
jgi:hypothetical protein